MLILIASYLMNKCIVNNYYTIEKIQLFIYLHRGYFPFNPDNTLTSKIWPYFVPLKSCAI